MKQFLFISVLTLQFQFCIGQCWASHIFLDFEDSSCLEYLLIDTIQNPNNVWQIGRPQKTVFDEAYLGGQNVLVTDTINHYGTNDTSSFIITSTAGHGFTAPQNVRLSAHFKVDSDSLNDFGLIEFSPDNGITWVTILGDTASCCCSFGGFSPQPEALTGYSSNWPFFVCELASFGPLYNIQSGDTVLYRFSFISDSISDSRDGLMFDWIVYEDGVESVNEFGYQSFNSKAYPNPAIETVTIKVDDPNFTPQQLIIYNSIGTKTVEMFNIQSNIIEIDLNNLAAGLYNYSLISTKKLKISTGKFTVTK